MNKPKDQLVERIEELNTEIQDLEDLIQGYVENILVGNLSKKQIRDTHTAIGIETVELYNKEDEADAIAVLKWADINKKKLN